MPQSARRAVALVGLVAVTVGAALALTWFDAREGSNLWPDPQQPSQFAASWRAGAIFAYTSGSVIGHICALFAGYLGARWWGRYYGVLAGFGIGVVNLAASARMAVPITLDPDTMAGAVGYVDPNPLHQPAVLGAMAAVLIMAIVMACLGTAVAIRVPGPQHALGALALLVPLVHLIGYVGFVTIGVSALD